MKGLNALLHSKETADINNEYNLKRNFFSRDYAHTF